MTDEHTAGLIIKILPTPDPTKDEIWVENLGPRTLSPAEMLDTLRLASALAELKADQQASR